MQQQSVRSQFASFLGHPDGSIQIGLRILELLGIRSDARYHAALSWKARAPAAEDFSALLRREKEPASRVRPDCNSSHRLIRHVADIRVLRGAVYAALAVERHRYGRDEAGVQPLCPFSHVDASVAHFVAPQVTRKRNPEFRIQNPEYSCWNL